MSDVTTLSARTDRHPEFDHVALYHDGADDLAEQLVPGIVGALDAGDAVMVCSSPMLWHSLSSKLGAASGRVEYMVDEVRYDNPNRSMRFVHDFVRDSTSGGARAVWSIGSIPFDGDATRDAEWLRYESAVNAVLGHLPLRAICTYDTGTTAPEVLERARCAHTDGQTDSIAVVPPIPLPDTEPMLRLDVHSSRSARHAVAAAYEDWLDHDARSDLTLIVSELVSNASAHGAPPVTVSAWHDESSSSSVIDVTDHGAGIDDPFVDLRPPRHRPGGAGMWIVGQLSARVTAQRVDGVHHVTVLIRH